MLTLRACFLVVVVTLTAACGGGGGSPTSPTPSATTPPATTTPPTATPAPQPPSNFGVFTFTFDAGTSVADQELIGSATQIANDFFTATLGRTITTATLRRLGFPLRFDG